MKRIIGGINGVVIISRNRPVLVHRCIESLRKYVPKASSSIILVDDSDKSQESICSKDFEDTLVVNRQSWCDYLSPSEIMPRFRGRSLKLGERGWNTPNARNIAQLVVKNMGWKSVLYLDDDVVAGPIGGAIIEKQLPSYGIHTFSLAGSPDFACLDWIELWFQLNVGRDELLSSLDVGSAARNIKQYTNLPITDVLRSKTHKPGCISYSGLAACFVASGATPVGFFPRVYDEDLYRFRSSRFGALQVLPDWQHHPPVKNVLCHNILIRQIVDNIAVRTMLIGPHLSKKFRISHCGRLLGRALRRVDNLMMMSSMMTSRNENIESALSCCKSGLKLWEPEKIEKLASDEQWNDAQWSNIYGSLD